MLCSALGSAAQRGVSVHASSLLCLAAKPGAAAADLPRSGFLEIWLLIMPFALFPNNSARRDPIVSQTLRQRNPLLEMVLYFLVCMLMLGIDEVCNQLEQPFPHMPLKSMVETTLRDINRTKEEAETMARLGARRLIPGGGGSSDGGCGPSTASCLDVDVVVDPADVV